MNDKTEIILIAGVHANDTKVYYWEWNGYSFDVPDSGDYAVVECFDDFALVKVIGSMKLKSEFAKCLIGHSNLKKAVKKISRFEMEA